MINLEVSEGYAFDYLSILAVKLIKNPDNDFNRINYSDCLMNLRENIANNELFNKIIDSKEFDDLIKVNTKLFDLVSLAKNDLCFASAVDKEVFNRYLAKVALQNKFFSESLSEVKIGY